MGPAFTLRSSDKRISLEMSRPSVVYRNGERFNSYIVILRGDPVTAGQGLLDNDVYLWAEFFEEIASQKANWSGAKYHESDGGILRMKCTGDAAGGVDLHIALWHRVARLGLVAEGTIHLEEHKLKGVAAAARRFFASRPEFGAPNSESAT